MKIYLFILIVTFSLIQLCQPLPLENRSSKVHLKSVTYTPLKADGTCRTATDITATVKRMKAAGISNIRTYSQNCNQLATILKAIKANGGGMTVLAGVYIDGSKNDNVEIATLKSVLTKKKNTQYIRGILVGNELVFNQVMSSTGLIKKIKTVKAFAKGYKVGTSEIFTSYTKDLMNASDIIAVNLHPFFSQVKIGDAMKNLAAQYKNFKKLTGRKKVYISETGWPSAGNDYGAAHPSVANMKKFATLLAKSNLPYYYFEWEDSAWKQPGDYGIEPHWGLLGTNGKAKFSLNSLK